MRDFLPVEVRKREYVIGVIKEVYESYGFEPLETPAVENIETLTGKYGEEGNQLIYKILKRGEKLDANAGEKDLADLALRYDLTVPLARVVANHKNDLPRFFKRYQIQPVWRADRPARGRYREFYQCDVDAIGSNSMLVEAELISAVGEILQKLKFGLGNKNFKIKINHRQILRGILETAGIPEEKHIDALVALDKFDKVGREGVKEEFIKRNITTESTEKLLTIVMNSSEHSIEAFPDETGNLTLPDSTEQQNTINLQEIENFISESNEGKNGVSELKSILKSISPYLNNHIEFDVKLARGLSYYTGAIFEIELDSDDFNISLGGGGRYDGLIGMFGKEQIPACGFSLGLERILVVMEERGMFQRLVDEGKLKLDSADVMIASFNESLIDECLKLAGDLRKSGLRTLVYPEANQKIKPLKYAEQINVPFVCLVKAEELAENTITLKNMRTSEQEILSRENIAGKIKKLLS